MKLNNTLYAFSFPVLLIALLSLTGPIASPGDPAPTTPPPITYKLSPSQSSSLITCTERTGYNDLSCYATKIWAPLTVNFQQLVDSFPSELCTLSIQLADTLKGKTTPKHPPYIYANKYCRSSGVRDSIITASLNSYSYNAVDTTTNINIEVDLIFQLSSISTLSGGLCVIIETMDPLSPIDAKKPTPQSVSMTVGDHDFTPQDSTTLSTPRLDCTKCRTPN